MVSAQRLSYIPGGSRFNPKVAILHCNRHECKVRGLSLTKASISQPYIRDHYNSTQEPQSHRLTVTIAPLIGL